MVTVAVTTTLGTIRPISGRSVALVVVTVTVTLPSPLTTSMVSGRSRTAA